MKPTEQSRHTLSLRVSHKPGVLIRVALVFSRRGYNIDSLVVSAAQDPRFALTTIVATGDEAGLEQVLKQLNKLVDVVHATDHTGEDLIQRELAMLKLECTPANRPEILQLANAVNCTVLEIGEETLILQVANDPARIDDIVRLFKLFGTVEAIRTGKVLMARGSQPTF